MATQAKDQLAFDEQVIEDPSIERILEDRLKAQDVAASARKDVKTATDRAMVAIEKLELPVGGAARVGRFRITRTVTPARSVSFDTEAKDRVKISLAETAGETD